MIDPVINHSFQTVEYIHIVPILHLETRSFMAFGPSRRITTYALFDVLCSVDKLQRFEGQVIRKYDR